LSRRKGAAAAIIAVVAVFGGLVTYAYMTRQPDEGPAPVLTTTVDRNDGQDNESTTISEDAQEQPQQGNGTIFANNTVIADNTVVINKPVYRNNTIIYQPVTINLENYRTTVNQYAGPDDDQPADTSHSITIRAKRIQSDDWNGKFTDDRVGIFTAVYDLRGNLVKTGYADERGFTVEGLEDKLYFVYPADCDNCDDRNDIMFRQWEDGSKDRPRLVPADSDVTASYRLVVPEKTRLVPLILPGETTPPADETGTAAEPGITLQAQNATFVYGWVQVSAQVKNMVEGFDDISISVYKPDGMLLDSFSYPEQQGFFASRDSGEGSYMIVATYEYDKGSVEASITHPVKFATPEFANLVAAEDNGTVRLNGMLKGGLAGENITVAIHDPNDQLLKQYAMSFGTRPVFTLFISGEDAPAIFNQTGNYTFVVTHVQTGVQGNATLFHQANETGTATAPVNVSNNTGGSEHAAIAAQGSDVYLVWEDDTSGQQEIFFAKSDDSGETFSEPISIGKSPQGGFALMPDIAVAGENVYVVWADYNPDEQSAVAFRSSNDSGETFGNKTMLGEYDGESAHPHVTVFKNSTYVAWVTGAEEEFTGDLVLARTSDGASFEAAVVSENADNPVMASSDSMLYLAWRNHPSGDTTDVGTNMFASSPDGTDFETYEVLQEMTIYSMAASADSAYVAGTGFENEDVIVARTSDGISFNTTSVASGDFPDIAANEDSVYVVWTDDQNRIFLAASTDGGRTFGERESLGEGFRPAVAAGDGTYVAWTEDSDVMVVAR
jgi:hypothetical protein